MEEAKKRAVAMAAASSLASTTKKAKGSTPEVTRKVFPAVQQHQHSAQPAKKAAMNTTYNADDEDEEDDFQDARDENDASELNSTYTKPQQQQQQQPQQSKANGVPPAPKLKKTESYDITPARHELDLPPEPLDNPENYNINDLDSGDETDDEEAPRKQIPSWAEGKDPSKQR